MSLMPEMIIRRLAPRERVALIIAGQYSGRSVADIAAMAGTGRGVVHSALRKAQWLGLCLLPARQPGGVPIVLTTSGIADAVNTINTMLLQLAEQTAEDYWDMIACGALRLTAEAGQLHVDAFDGSKDERRMVGMLNYPFVEARFGLLGGVRG